MDFAGRDSFQYAVSDGEEESVPATVTIRVAPRNDGPRAISRNVSTPEDTSVAIQLTGADPESDPLVFQVLDLPAHGRLTTPSGAAIQPLEQVPQGALRYAPDSHYRGSDRFNFRVSDAQITSGAARVDITVTPVNDRPSSKDTRAATREDIDLVLLLNNFAFMDNDSAERMAEVKIVTQPGRGTLYTDANGNAVVDEGEEIAAGSTVDVSVLVAGATKFKPIPGESGIPYTSFQFRVSDGLEASVTDYQFTFDVLPVNDKPVAHSHSVVTQEDVVLSIALTGTDPEGSSLRFAISQQPVHGKLSGIVPNVVYTPAANYSGADSFQFVVSDESLTSTPATVNIQVQPVNDPPLARFVAVPKRGVGPLTVAFDGASSLDRDGQIVKYEWDFNGDNVTDAEGIQVAHTFASVAMHNIRLTVEDNEGARANAIDTVEVLCLAPGGGLLIEPNEITERLYRGSSATRELAVTNLYNTAVTFNLALAGHHTPGSSDYVWTDSLSNPLVTVALPDLRITGTRVSLEANGTAVIPMNVVFPFYGGAYRHAIVHGNGTISFSAFNGQALPGLPFPSPRAPETLIAPLWADLEPGAAGAIYMLKEVGRFVLQFDRFRHRTRGGEFSYQIELFADGTMQWNYLTVSEDLPRAFAAIQSFGETKALNLPVDSGLYVAGTSIVLSRLDEWFGAAATETTILPGETQRISVPVAAWQNARLGLHEGTLSIVTNRTDLPDFTIPIALDVLNRPPEASVTAPVPFASILDGVSVQLQAEALDVDGSVVEVQFYIDDQLVGTATELPFAVDWNQPTTGNHRVQVVARDYDGELGESPEVPFEIVPHGGWGDFVVRPLQLSEQLLAGGSVQRVVNLENHYHEPVDWTITLTNNTTGNGTGYSWSDSRTDSSVVYQWNDIAQPANKLAVVTASDDVHQQVALSFPFTFYGVQHQSLFVHSNGFISLGTAPDDYYAANVDLPGLEAPVNMIAPFWDDLQPGGGGSGTYGGDREDSAIYFKDFGSYAIIQWEQSGSWSGWGLCTFQIKLLATGEILFYYKDIQAGRDNATVGIQNADRTSALSIAFDEPFIEDGLAVRIGDGSLGYEWLGVDKISGRLLSGETTTVDVSFFADNAAQPTSLSGGIRVDHTQPGLAPYQVQASLAIVDSRPSIDWITPARRLYLLPGTPVDLEVAATDADGSIDRVEFTLGGALLARVRNEPYRFQWTSFQEGLGSLAARAFDEDGLEARVDERLVIFSHDTDADGLPDAFEEDYLGSLASGALDDDDNDGISNIAEWANGLNPILADALVPPNSLPIAAVSATPIAALAPATVAFDASDSIDRDGRIISYSWDFDGNGTDDASGPTAQHLYGASGSFFARLRVTDDRGGHTDKVIPIRIKETAAVVVPIARIQADPPAGDAALQVSFDGSSSTDADGFITEFTWSFGDGSGTTVASGTHVYEQPGTYELKLTVRDDDGATATTSRWITVFGLESHPFIERGGIVTIEAAHFSQIAMNRDCTAWQLGDPASGGFARSMSPGYGVSGFENAKAVRYRVLVSTAGNYYLALRRSNFGGGKLGVGVDGREVSDPVNGEFRFGSNPHAWTRGIPLGFLGAGEHTIDLRPMSGNEHLWIDRLIMANDKRLLPIEDSLEIGPAESPRRSETGEIEYPRPIFTISNEPRISPVTLQFDASGSLAPGLTIERYAWQFDDLLGADGADFVSKTAVSATGPVVTHLFRRPGIYRVRLELTDSEGQLELREQEIEISDPTQAWVEHSSITVDDADPEVTVQGPWALAGLWVCLPDPNLESSLECEGYFGRDAFFAAQNIFGTHYRNNLGNADGKSVSFRPSLSSAGTYLVYTRWPGKARSSFSRERFNAGYSSKTPFSVAHSGGITEILVDQRVGDGDWNLIGAFGFNPASGHGVSVSDRGADGLVLADAVRFVRADAVGGNTAPVASFTGPISGVAAFTAEFDASASNDAEGEIALYLWNFGDGRTARGRTVSQRYSVAGNYTVSLTVIDAAGAATTTSRALTVQAPPTAAEPEARFNVSAEGGVAPLAMTFDASPSSAPAGVAEYRWNFGDGFSATGAAVSHVFREAGIYSIELALTDTQDRKAVASTQITVRPRGAGNGLGFIVDNSDPAAFTTSGEWRTVRVGKDAVGMDYVSAASDDAAVRVTPQFPGAGRYQVYAWLPFSGGACEDSLWDFTVQHAAGTSNVSVNITSTFGKWIPLGTYSFDGGRSGSISWGKTSQTQIMVADALMFVLEGSVTNAVLGTSPLRGEAPLTVEFDATASVSAQGPLQYAWDFGDGSTHTADSTVSHRYDQAGSYLAKLTVTDATGGRAVATRTVEVAPVNAAPLAVLSASALAGKATLRVAFDASASSDDGRIVSYRWNFGDGGTASEPSPTHAFTLPGSYQVQLTVTDDRGATAAASETVVVTRGESAPSASLTVSAIAGEAPWEVIFDLSQSQDADGDLAQIHLDFGDGVSEPVLDLAQNVRHVYLRPGIYLARLTVTDTGGRSDQALVPIVVSSRQAFLVGGSELLIDNRDTSKVIKTGTWTPAVSPAGFHAADYEHEGAGIAGAASFSFRTSLEASDEYMVLLRWPAAPGNSAAVPVTLTHAGGQSSMTVDQTANGGTWNLLGIYAFESGSTAEVKLTNAGANGRVSADAVLFIRLNPAK